MTLRRVGLAVFAFELFVAAAPCRAVEFLADGAYYFQVTSATGDKLLSPAVLLRAWDFGLWALSEIRRSLLVPARPGR